MQTTQSKAPFHRHPAPRRPRHPDGRARAVRNFTATLACVAACGGPVSTTGGAPSADGAVTPDSGNAEPDGSADAGQDRMAIVDSQDTQDAAADRPVDARAEPPPRTTTVACGAFIDIVEACVLSADGALAKMPVTGTMTIAATEAIPAGTCRLPLFDWGSTPSTDMATRVTLDASDGSHWTIVLRMPGLPAALLRAGETIDLSLDAYLSKGITDSFNQTIAIKREGRPVFVASTLHRMPGLVLPEWMGVTVETVDEGAVCVRTAGLQCTNYEHSLRLSYAGDSTSLQIGHTGKVASLNLALESFSELFAPQCDGPGFTQIAGFWAP